LADGVQEEEKKLTIMKAIATMVTADDVKKEVKKLAFVKVIAAMMTAGRQSPSLRRVGRPRR
jgi:hypothetical protein